MHIKLTNFVLGSSITPPISEEENPIVVSTTAEPSSSNRVSLEANTSDEGGSHMEPLPDSLDRGEEQNIIETMDADACVLRQRRLAFYDNWTNANRGTMLGNHFLRNKYESSFSLHIVFFYEFYGTISK